MVFTILISENCLLRYKLYLINYLLENKCLNDMITLIKNYVVPKRHIIEISYDEETKRPIITHEINKAYKYKIGSYPTCLYLFYYIEYSTKKNSLVRHKLYYGPDKTKILVAHNYIGLKQNGEQKSWYQSGNVYSVATINNEKNYEKKEVYNENGSLRFQKEFVNEKYISDINYGENGILQFKTVFTKDYTRTTNFYNSGSIESIVNYKGGTRSVYNGRYDTYYEDGTPKTESLYEDDNLIYEKTWYKNGTLKSSYEKIPKKGFTCEKILKEYNKNGQLVKKRHNLPLPEGSDDRNAITIEWNDDGTVKSREFYNNGKQSNLWINN